jgi:hypothetical protein
MRGPCDSGHSLGSGAVARGAMAPPIVETRRKIVNVVGNCQSCRRGGGDLKCCRPETFLVCRKNFPLIVETRRKIVNVVGKVNVSVCRKSTALGPP